MPRNLRRRYDLRHSESQPVEHSAGQGSRSHGSSTFRTIPTPVPLDDDTNRAYLLHWEVECYGRARLTGDRAAQRTRLTQIIAQAAELLDHLP